MIPANKSPRFVRWFSKQTEKRIRKMFSRVYVHGEDRLRNAAAATPVLVVSNHTSWWDPMSAIYLAHRLLGIDAFAMMDEKNLRKLPFLGRIGGFGIQLDNASDTRRVLKYAAGLLDRPGRLVWIFPEGAERPRSLGVDEFKPGAAVVAKWAKGCRVMPVGLRYEFGGKEHPEAFISIGEPTAFTDNIDGDRQAQRTAVSVELEKIDSFIRDRNDDADFVLKMEQAPQRTAALAERILCYFTRYENGKNP